MSDQFLGEIRLFAGTFAPRDWAFCDGSLINIRQNTALFSLLGTYYGGDGKTTFALPDFRGRVPVHQGAGPGLTLRTLGETGGSETFTMTSAEMPQHSHGVVGTSNGANIATPTAQAQFANAPGGRGQQGPPVYINEAPNTPLAPTTISISGNSQPISLIKPVLGLNFIIALQGIFPPRP